MIFALFLTLISGALCALVICKAIHLKLWADAVTGLGSAMTLLLAGRIAGAESWPMLGWPVGFAAAVVYLKWRQA